jgi:hypothetical protein
MTLAMKDLENKDESGSGKGSSFTRFMERLNLLVGLLIVLIGGYALILAVLTLIGPGDPSLPPGFELDEV